MQDYNKLIRIVLLLLSLYVGSILYGRIFEPRVPELDPDSISFTKETALGVRVDAASSDLEKRDAAGVDLERAKREIDLIAGLGAEVARFDLEKDMLAEAEDLSGLDQAIAYARSKKLQIYLSFLGRRSWLSSPSVADDRSYGAGGKASWEEFKRGYKDDVVWITNRYRPDYFLILPDCPRVVGQQVDSQRSMKEWFDFAKETGLTIKKISFPTQVALEGVVTGEGKGAGETEFADVAMSEDDAAIDIFSMRSGDIKELEGGMKRMLSIRDKYHWRGKIWMGSVSPAEGSSAEEQEDYLLYSLHLASSEGFSGVVIGRLCDSAGEDGGLAKEDYSLKPSYAAIKEVLSGRKK